MGRVFIKLAYKGTNFFGWQIQPDHRSIQGEIENALKKLHHNKEIKIVGCGRTDTGVHSSEYFAHADLDLALSKSDIKFKLNNMLDQDIVIHDIIDTTAESHARFDALKRTYHYFIHDNKDPFVNEISWYRSGQLNIKKMNEACLLLLKHDDFECFSKVKTETNTFLCNITNAAWIKSDKGYIFTISANRFLRNMVRAIVGTMIEIGEEKITIDDFQHILDSKNRSKAGTSVPAKGLFLAKIEYDFIK